MRTAQVICQRIWKFLRPELREILYLVLGFLLGLASTWYFEIQNATEHKVTLLRGAINELSTNVLPSWYPMYFDSASHVKDFFPYPTLDEDGLSALRMELWLFTDDLSSDSVYSALGNRLTETLEEIGEFNERIRLRNFSIIDGHFSFIQNELGFHTYQSRVHPKLTLCKNLLDSTLKALDP